MQLKNTFLTIVMTALLAFPTMVFAQSTEGTDFWVTLMRADSDSPEALYLAVSALKAANVTIANPTTGYSHTLSLPDNGHDTVRVAKQDCYVGTADDRKVTNKALHVTSDQPISLVAANYKDKSFDVAAVLPTAALLDDYVVCTYPATVHANSDQGTHFAIVATEDNTVVDYSLGTVPDTIQTLQNLKNLGFELTAAEQAFLDAYNANPYTETNTVNMNAGQVFYYWTGPLSGDASDLTGTTVKARDGKKIAVFNGDCHTNIPNKTRDRDHIYSQAMPTAYWGTQFALTSSLTTSEGASGLVERIDKVRVQALEDGTVVVVNGDTLHVFDFSVDTKHYFEFEFGANTVAATPFPAGTPRLNTTNCFVRTSCPCGVHLYMVSNRYDYPDKNSITGSKFCNGDPSMIWINPIEQQIEEITFGTFQTKQVEDHFLNIVTASTNTNITLDGTDISSQFTVMGGNAKYKFARLKIANGTHTLKAAGGAIAHVYGFGKLESYGYPAGAKTIPLEQSIMINDVPFTASSQNTLCGQDTIHFSCDLNYEVTDITWNFGDGSPMVSGADKTQVDHYYPKTGDYPAYVLIRRESANLCVGQVAEDSIPIMVHIGRLEFSVVDTVNTICENRQLKLYYKNTGTALTSSNCTYEFNDKAKSEGFTSSSLSMGTDYFLLTIPNGASEGKGYAFTVEINTGCGDTAVSVGFTVPFDPNSLLVQRWDNILGVKESAQYESFQWFKDGELMEGENGPVLNLNDVTDFTSGYTVQIRTKDGQVIETCPYVFVHNTDAEPVFGDADAIGVITGKPDEFLFFSTSTVGTAEMYSADGKLISSTKLLNDGGYVKMPSEKGIYVLSVETDNEKRSMKIFVME